MQSTLLRFGKHLLVTILFASVSILSHAQNQINIPFGTKISLQDLGLHANESITWSLKDSNQVEITNNNQIGIENYFFSTPGKFRLDVQGLPSSTHSECSHGSGFQESWLIKVSDIKIEFLTNQISFSTNLTSANLPNGVILEIPIQVAFQNNSAELKYSDLKVQMQGVDCNVGATILNSEVIHSPGNYTLKVNLKGAARSQSYIMIDFTDMNGNITTYYHSTQL